MTSQEKRNMELAASNTTLRKQVAKSHCVEAELEEKVTSMEKELTISEVAQVAAQVKLEATLKQMKSVVVDATLHARAELIE